MWIRVEGGGSDNVDRGSADMDNNKILYYYYKIHQRG